MLVRCNCHLILQCTDTVVVLFLLGHHDLHLYVQTTRGAWQKCCSRWSIFLCSRFFVLQWLKGFDFLMGWVVGLGWKSWKRRWFILTRTSLVFFKNDPVSWEANLNNVALLFGHASDTCNNAELIRGKKSCWRNYVNILPCSLSWYLHNAVGEISLQFHIYIDIDIDMMLWHVPWDLYLLKD